MCIAKYTLDDTWYRAEVVCVEKEGRQLPRIGVLYVDYGNSEYLNPEW